MEKVLGVIITYRNRIKNLEMLSKCIIAEAASSRISFYLINLGDKNPLISELCEKAEIKHVFINYESTFNLGYAFNLGFDHCKEKYIMKLDVDCVFYRGFFKILLNELPFLKSQDFLLISVFYATDAFSKKHLNSAPISKRIYKKLEYEMNSLAKYPTGTMFVLERHLYSQIGGHDTKFTGHGYEDFWLIIKLLKFKYPNLSFFNFNLIKARRICGILNQKTNRKQLILIHRYHDRNFLDTYYQYKEVNEKLLFENFISLT